jgi:hypothetical protein
MTLHEWRKRPDLIAELALIVKNPTFQIAMSVLTEIGIPRTTFNPATPNIIENNALLGSRIAGFFECQKCLLALADPPLQKKDSDALVSTGLTEWGYASKRLEAQETPPPSPNN